MPEELRVTGVLPSLYARRRPDANQSVQKQRYLEEEGDYFKNSLSQIVITRRQVLRGLQDSIRRKVTQEGFFCQ